MANVYTTAGKAKIPDYIDGVDATPLTAAASWVAWGTGAGTAAVGDTTLFTEATEARVNPAISQPAADTNRWIATMTADAGKTITNAGLFNASAAGTMFVKGHFTGVVLASGDKIEFTITLQQT